MAKLSGASPVLKRGCAPGSTDPGCPGNFKIKRKGTKIGRFLSKSFRNLKYNVKSSIDKIKANKRKKNKTNFEKSRRFVKCEKLKKFVKVDKKKINFF